MNAILLSNVLDVFLLKIALNKIFVGIVISIKL